MVNEIKHTSGNWIVQDNSEDGYGQIRVDSDTFGAVAVCYSGGNGEKEDLSWALANAKLIAAAPELLHELNEARGAIEAILKEHPGFAGRIFGSTTLGNHRVQIKAAIQKATT